MADSGPGRAGGQGRGAGDLRRQRRRQNLYPPRAERAVACRGGGGARRHRGRHDVLAADPVPLAPDVKVILTPACIFLVIIHTNIQGGVRMTSMSTPTYRTVLFLVLQ